MDFDAMSSFSSHSAVATRLARDVGRLGNVLSSSLVPFAFGTVGAGAFRRREVLPRFGWKVPSSTCRLPTGRRSPFLLSPYREAILL